MIISDEFGRNQNRAIPGPKNSNSSRDVRVYIARYEYNPYEGPNPCPEVELYLHAGKNINLNPLPVFLFNRVKTMKRVLARAQNHFLSRFRYAIFSI